MPIFRYWWRISLLTDWWTGCTALPDCPLTMCIITDTHWFNGEFSLSLCLLCASIICNRKKCFCYSIFLAKKKIIIFLIRVPSRRLHTRFISNKSHFHPFRGNASNTNFNHNSSLRLRPAARMNNKFIIFADESVIRMWIIINLMGSHMIFLSLINHWMALPHARNTQLPFSVGKSANEHERLHTHRIPF